MLWLQREHRNDPSRLPVMALKVVPSMQYGHRMTVGILKRLGFGRLAALLKCKVGRAGYKSSTAVGKWKASSCEPPRQTGRRLPQTAAAYRSTPYQVTGRKARATSRQGKVSSLLGILATFRAARKAAVDLHFTTGRDVGLLSRGSGQLVQMSLY